MNDPNKREPALLLRTCGGGRTENHAGVNHLRSALEENCRYAYGETLLLRHTGGNRVNRRRRY